MSDNKHGLVIGIEIQGEELIQNFDKTIGPFVCGENKFRNIDLNVYKTQFLDHELSAFYKYSPSSSRSKILWMVTEIEIFPITFNEVDHNELPFFGTLDTLSRILSLMYSSKIVLHFIFFSDRDFKPGIPFDLTIEERNPIGPTSDKFEIKMSEDELNYFSRVYYRKIGSSCSFKNISNKYDYSLAQKLIRSILSQKLPDDLFDFNLQLHRAGNLDDLDSLVIRCIIAIEGIATAWTRKHGGYYKFLDTVQGNKDKNEFTTLFKEFIKEMVKKYKETGNNINKLESIRVAENAAKDKVFKYLYNTLGIRPGTDENDKMIIAIKKGYKLRNPDSHGRITMDADAALANEIFGLCSRILEYEMTQYFNSVNNDNSKEDTVNHQVKTKLPSNKLIELTHKVLNFIGRSWDKDTAKMYVIDEFILDAPELLQSLSVLRKLPDERKWDINFQLESKNLRSAFNNRKTGLISSTAPNTIITHKFPSLIAIPNYSNHLYFIRIRSTNSEKELLTSFNYHKGDELVNYHKVNKNEDDLISFYFENDFDKSALISKLSKDKSQN